MNKYQQVVTISWDNGLVYRTSLALWRIRQFLASLMALTVWSVIFSANATFGSYQQSEMITYLFLVAFTQNVIFASIINGLAGEIYSGRLSLILVKPIHIFGYLLSLDIADKAKNIFFICLESVLLYLIFQPTIQLPSLATFGLVTVLIIMATLLNFLISLLFGAIGFWSPDSWAPRFMFFMLVDFTAGRLYPLDILPPLMQKVLYVTPFPYLSFVQIQIFLGRFNPAQIGMTIIMLVGWIVLLSLAVTKIWARGLKDYTAVGQ